MGNRGCGPVEPHKSAGGCIGYFFYREEFLLAGDAPAVAGEIAVRANHAMTRNDDGNGIRGAGASDGAYGARTAEGAGNLAVRARRAARDALEFLPDAALKCGRLKVERKVLRGSFAVNAAQNFANPAFKTGMGRRKFRARIFLAKFLKEPGVRVAQIDGGDAALGCGDQDVAELRFRDRVADLHSITPFLIGSGRHAEVGVAALIDAAG